MDSATRLRVGVDAEGATRAVELRCEVPQLLRVTEAVGSGFPTLQVHLVGGAAGPLGGDRWALDLDLAAGSRVCLRSVAASMAQPDPHGRSSEAAVRVRVGAGAVLDAWPEPIVSVRGSHHTLDVALEVERDGDVRWVDEVILGRHGEVPGTVVLRQRLTEAGRVRVMSEVRLGGDPGAASFGQHGPFRAVITAVGRFDGPSGVVLGDGGARAVRCAVGEGWSTWTGVGDGRAPVWRLLAALGLER